MHGHDEAFHARIVSAMRLLVKRVGAAVLLTGLLLPPFAGLLALAEGQPHWTAYRGAFGATEWFSSLQLLMIAACAWITYGVRGARDSDAGARWIWAVLAAGFVVLSLDERFDLHEALRNEVYRPLGIFVNVTWIKPGEVALFTFIAAALALSRWVLIELALSRKAVGLYVCGLVMSVVVATLDALPDAMILSWPAAGFWDYTAEEVGEIWAEMLFLGAFLTVLDRRLAQLADDR